MKVNIDNRNSKTKRRKVICWIYRVLPFILLILLSVGTFRIVLAIMLRSKLAAIRAAGYPVTLAELNDYYPAVPDDENAALLYKQASTLMRSPYEKIFKKDNKKSPDLLFADETTEETGKSTASFPQLVIMVGSAPDPILGEHLTQKSLAANRRFIATNKHSLKMLNQAITRVKSRFPIDLSSHIFNLHHLNYLRSLTSLLSLNTIIAAEMNKRQLAMENILTMLKMCHAMDDEPMLISYLASIIIQAKTITTIEYALNLVKFDDNSLQQISSALQYCLAQQDKNFQRVLIGERVAIININRKLAEYYKMPYQFDKFTGILTLNQLKIIELYDLLFTITAKCNGITIKHDIDKFRQQLKALPYFYILPKKLLPYSTNAIYRKISIKTKLKSAIIGIAIERYRLKYHRLPKSLSELAPEFIQQVPNDPFTNRPFRYVVGDIEIPIDKRYRKKYSDSYEKKNAIKYQGSSPIYYFIKRRGWMIYSLGQDGDDDNGIPRGILNGQGCNINGDIPFRNVRR